MSKYFISHDIGSSGNKASLVSYAGVVINSYTSPYSMNVFNGNWAEENPEDWWKAFCQSNRAVLKGIDPSEVGAVCVGGQMMTCLPVDKNGAPLHTAIIYADGRAVKETDQVMEIIGMKKFYKTVGNPPSANYTLPKIMWMKKNHPDIYEKTYKFLVSKDFINAKLTGVFATDTSDSGFMHMYDMNTGNWAKEMLDALKVDREKLPDIVPVGTVLGEVRSCVAEECGLLAGTPVVMGMGDGSAVSLGIGCINPGDSYTSIGTSSWVGVATNSLKLDETCSISKLPYYRSDLYMDFGSMQAGGYSLELYKEMFCGEEKQLASQNGKNVFDIMTESIKDTPAGANGILYLPYPLGERCPWWDSNAKAAFMGIKASSVHADFTKAVLEGVSLHLGMILNRVRALSPVYNMRIAGGGAKSQIWRQIFADIYNLPITKTNVTDQAGALGSAVIAGVGIGVYPSLDVVKDFHKIESVTEPIAENVKIYEELIKIYEDAYHATKDISHRLGNL